MKSVDRLAALLLPLLLAAPLAAQSSPSLEESAPAGFGAAVEVAAGAVFVGEGANVMRPGRVYVYKERSGTWSESQRLTAPDAATGDGFGRSLAALPDLLLVGQVSSGRDGVVHLFTADGEGWSHAGTVAPAERLSDARFGAALAVSGSWLAVGAPGGDGGAGRVHMFRREGAAWRERAVVEPSDGRPEDAFGAAIALDGARMLVGAPGRAGGEGAAFVFREDPESGEWVEEGALEAAGLERRAGFGSAVALAGTDALVGAPGLDGAVGAVFAFARAPDAGGWRSAGRLSPFDGGRFTRFGAALGFDGREAYVGAPGAGPTGAIYVVARGEAGDWRSVEKVTAAGVSAGGGFGATLALGPSVAVAGATGEDYGAGAAVILAREGGTWRVASKVVSEPESLPGLTGEEIRCEGGSVAGTFACSGVDLLAFLPVHAIGGGRGVELNDVWGWTDPGTGREYVLAGRVDGTSFVDISDPTDPRYLGDLPKTAGSNAAVWRDIKVFGDHAFIVADGAGAHGMQVFDLTRLRDVAEPTTFDEDAHYAGIASAHNLVIDTASGFAFAVGARGGGETCGGGLHMIDIRDPERPEFAGCFADPRTGRASTGYSHDAQCVTYEGPDPDYRGHEICLGSNETALSIADVTDKDAPVAVARSGYPNVGYTHQGWLTEDQRYFFMNDELDELQGKTERTRTLIWDVSDLDDPILAGEFMGTTEASDHNLYVRGSLMYQSNYQAGLRIIDVGDPLSPREIGYFDTVPYGDDTPGFGGSWSNYPFFPSGTIAVTSGNEGLFLLRKREPVS